MNAIKISNTGEHLAADATGHAAVLLPDIGLMFAVGALPDPMPHAAAEKATSELNLAGFTDWRLPTVQELVSIVDYSRKSPACDTDLFPDAEADWYWTGTDSAWSSGSAWIVSFNYGSVLDLRRSYTAFVRAVRRVAPASQ